MTFEQMPYERVDLQSLVQTYEELTRQMRQAASAQEAAQVLRRHQQVYEPAATMMGLSAIRHTIDTEDPFYTGEEEFYAENGPALGEKSQRPVPGHPGIPLPGRAGTAVPAGLLPKVRRSTCAPFPPTCWANWSRRINW